MKLYLVEPSNIDFKNMPNDEEFYFTIDLAGNKKVHRCKWIKDNPTKFKYILLEKNQLGK